MSDQSKTAGKQPAHLAAIPCCPPLTPLDVCDKLDFFYRLNHDVSVAVRGRHRNTILPVEKVKLFTSDRRTRFTFDSSSSLSYRNTQSSEESMYMQSMSDSLFDTNSRDTANSSNQSHAHVDGKADAGVDILGLGGSASM